jgi:hypothetical protein
MSKVRVNWHQKRVASDKLIRAHNICTPQPKGCRFKKMKPGRHNDYPSVAAAETAMRNAGSTRYKRCIHCWDNQETPL